VDRLDCQVVLTRDAEAERADDVRRVCGPHDQQSAVFDWGAPDRPRFVVLGAARRMTCPSRCACRFRTACASRSVLTNRSSNAVATPLNQGCESWLSRMTPSASVSDWLTGIRPTAHPTAYSWRVSSMR
jgi:hypothetical protein